MTFLCRVFFITLILTLHTRADDQIAGITGSTEPPACTTEQIHDKIGEMFGTEAQEAVESGGCTIIEIAFPSAADGAHDHDTIGVNTKSWGNTKMSLEEAAVVVHHENDHVANAQAAGTDMDPTTTGEQGTCEHANQHYSQALAGLNYLCEDLDLDLGERRARCAAIHDGIGNGDHWAAKCKEAGGTPPSSEDADSAFEACCDGTEE